MTSPEQPMLTNDQLGNLAIRTVHDAELIQGGAAYQHHGTPLPENLTGDVIIRPVGLDVPESQQDALYEKNVIEPQVKAFLEETPEGQEITSHKETLLSIKNIVGGRIGDVIHYDTKSRKEAQNLPGFESFLHTNGIDIDFDRLSRRSESSEYGSDISKMLSSFQGNLDTLARTLALSPDLRLNKKVNIRRPEDGSSLEEPEWVIEGFTAKGRVRVGQDGSDSYSMREVSADALSPAVSSEQTEVISAHDDQYLIASREAGGIVIKLAGEKAVNTPPDEIAADSKAPVNEFKRPELNSVFSDGRSLERTLRDPDVDPDIKSQLRAVTGAWQEVQTALVVDKAWNEVISPALSRLDEALPNLKGMVDNLNQVTEQMSGGLRILAEAIESRDIMAIEDGARRVGLESLIDQFGQNSQRLVNNNGLAQAAYQLGGDNEESADLVRRSLIREFDNEMDEASYDKLAGQVGPLIDQGLDLPQVIARIRQDVPEETTASWLRHQEDIATVVTFARLAGSNEELGTPFTQLNNELGAFREAMIRGSYDAAQAMYIRNSLLAGIQRKLEDLTMMTRLIDSYRRDSQK